LIIEVSRGIFFTSLVFLTVAFVPFLSAIMLIMIPLPILFYFEKLGRAGGVAVLVSSLLLVGAAQQLAGSHLSMAAFLILGSLGLIISETLKRRMTIGWTVSLAAGAGFVVISSVIVMNGALNEKLPWEHIYNYIQIMVQENIKLYGQLDLPAEQLQFLKDNSEKIVKGLTYTLPSLSLIGIAAIVVINIIPARILFKIHGLDIPDFGTLIRWKASDYLVWLLIGSSILLLIPLLWIKIVGLNLLIVCLFVYLIQGLTIMEFFFHKKRAPLLLRLLCYFLFIIQQYLLLFIIATGLLDLWIDFRKLQAPAQDINHRL